MILEENSEYITWKEKLTNCSTERLPVAWLHHPTFGGPLLDGAELIVEGKKIIVPPQNRDELADLKSGYKGEWPLAMESNGNNFRDCSKVMDFGDHREHVVVIGDFDVGWGCVWNEKRKLGFGLAWDKNIFPYALSWSTGTGTRKYPIWGSCRTITLQPSTSPLLPFDELVANDLVLYVEGDKSIETTIKTGFISNKNTSF